MRVLLRFIFLAVLSVMFFAVTDFAQEIDSRGKDFWLAFMPNFHNNIGSEDFPETAREREDSIYIFIAATEPTNGQIDYFDQFGQSYTKKFSIPDPKRVYIFSLQFYDYEVRGYNRSGARTKQHNEGKKSKLSFHVTSDKDISVYGHEQANTTSEAFVALPTDALGKENIVLSYYSDGTYEGGGSGSDQRTPSQFLIVASENDTKVTIRPSARTYSHGSDTHEVTLDSGETYLEQAFIDANNKSLDLTGTVISSDKPIALFGGHQRCRVPINFRSSRDCLIEQMPPVNTWGSNALLVPFEKAIDDQSDEPDRYRVLAAYDSTIVELPSNEMVRLDAGKFLERDLSNTEGGFVTASKPILVAQYKRTSAGSSATNTNGDPLMMIIPPVEQFSDFYRIINVQAHEWGQEVYHYQYITVVGLRSIVGKLQIDGTTLPGIFFNDIPGDEYVYASKMVSDGAHTVTADGERFGIYVYGYGFANSYGYYGGMSLRKLDPFPPQFQSAVNCFEAKGFVSDSTVGDSGLDTFLIIQQPDGNITYNIDDQNEKYVRFTAKLQNIYQDGSFTVEARDKSGRHTKRNIEIPGFTFSTTGTKELKVNNYVDTLMIGEKVCIEIPITNYGKYKQSLTRLGMRKGWPGSTLEGLPLELGPGETGTIRYCFNSENSAHYVDTIQFGTDCAMLDFATVDYLFAKDSLPPQSLVVDDPCMKNIKVFFTEGYKFDKGLKDLKVVTENMSYAIDTTSLRFLSLTCGVTDPYQDASMELTATDSVGNQTVEKREFPGFTLSFSTMDSVNKDFGVRRIGDYSCDSIMVTNYGKFKITIPDVFVYENVTFSLPQAQFPLTVLPGETRPLEVCYLPRKSFGERDRDSLRLGMNCVERLLRLSGQPEQIQYNVPGVCNLEIVATSGEYAERELTFGARALPSGEYLHLDIDGPGASGDLEIYSSEGSLVREVKLGALPSGKVSFDTPSADLSTGLYFVRLVYGSRSISRAVMLYK